MNLQLKDFAAFHEAVHGTPPFAWQERLLRLVDQDRTWPAVLDLPTGTGKTTCVDVALFALALDAGRPPGQRWCARRIVMVVDRRVVVDQVAERGRLLLQRLTYANCGVLVDVADALRRLVGDGEDPLAVYTLRGGIAKDDGWARLPHQPLIVASTVDQVGSRLLMQGYGVSPSMRPVHAGLLANDTLLLLDEVHLSRPFAQTLQRLKRLRSRWAATGDRPLQFALLSATPGELAADAFRLEDSERQPESVLGRRLHTRKPARLKEVVDRNALVGVCVNATVDAIARHMTIAVVVNRVASARRVALTLRRQLASAADVVLLTGRMRPLDRDDILASCRNRIASGRDRTRSPRPIVVVATQCIEAGADFDFDALITESASLDALRQRFGRLDRLGEYGRAEGLVIHVREDAKDDAIYGVALRATWNWLREQAGARTKVVDFGIDALRAPSDAGLLTPVKDAPLLLPAYLDLWAQTSPEPAIFPDVSLFLHGPESGPADVQVVWRADLQDAHLDGDVASAIAIVEAVRPSSLEAVSVPFAVARSWLSATPGDGIDFADVERTDDFHPKQIAGGKRALRWRGEESELIDASALRPGDTIIVPARRGGLSDGTFDPEADEPVADLAERATLLARGRAVLRLHPGVLAGLALPGDIEPPDVAAAATTALGTPGPAWRRAWLAALSRRLRRTVVELEDPRYDLTEWPVVEGRRLAPAELREAIREIGTSVEPGIEISTDDEDSVYVGRGGITLAGHCSDVEALAREYAAHLGLSAAMQSDLALAGWLHDIGKADPRFQLLLRGGDEIEWLKDESLWAKSAVPAGSKRARDVARNRSRYPAGARHEVQSVAMIESRRSFIAGKAHDPDLVLHLVGSHHGFCRPFAPPVVGDQPVSVSLSGHASEAFGTLCFDSVTSAHGLHRLDSPLADRFWGLVQRYGWLQLCWLEAIFRLADHRASEAEERDGEHR